MSLRAHFFKKSAKNFKNFVEKFGSSKYLRTFATANEIRRGIRLTVRTEDSHSSNRSSILLSRTKASKIWKPFFVNMKQHIASDIILQSHPMVDELRSTSANGAKGRLLVKQENIYHFHNHLCEIGLMEHMIQCATAKVRHKAAMKGKTDASAAVSEITRFSLNFLPKTNETIESTVKVISMQGGKANAIAAVHIEGEIAAICRIKITLSEQ